MGLSIGFSVSSKGGSQGAADPSDTSPTMSCTLHHLHVTACRCQPQRNVPIVNIGK